jgi:ubiquinone/menaquinone biosynthesis C-methylase UbiE
VSTSEEYYRTRFSFDRKRKVLWDALYRYYFSHLIRPEFSVLELGAGYGYFINAVAAKRRIAVDLWPGLKAHVDSGVEAHVGDIEDLSFLQDHSIDFALASNIFEHLEKEKLAGVLSGLRRTLKRGGTLNVIGPNYRFCYDEYFDDYTHVTIFSDRSLADFLEAHGFKVIESVPRFLPLTVKSRWPVMSVLIWLYLRSPIKPSAKQMLIRAVAD